MYLIAFLFVHLNLEPQQVPCVIHLLYLFILFGCLLCSCSVHALSTQASRPAGTSYILDSSVLSGFDSGQMFPANFTVPFPWHQIRGLIRSDCPTAGDSEHDEMQIRWRLTDLSRVKTLLVMHK